ncbi:MAG: APC family permease [Balneolaceae bacterium]|nr:APC family permease [Balneolaceae bacterium]
MSEERNETSQELERTLGLKPALTIGVGTMVGAGIFVFPGIAAGYAGPAAMISFALGGCIALLVAFSTAELATAMPESGGAYFFVSRTFGPMAGFLIGVGQWIGLVFASAFYLSGFGQYAVDLLEEAGLDLGNPVILIALATALVLTVINLLGTEGAGKVQNRIVIALTAILTFLFGYGLMNAIGIVGDTQWPVPFAPNGIWPIFTTTALIFTSYLGFVQIATVAGEIKQPQKNLPRALVGSVVIVMLLYITALFVSTSVLTTEELAELGETAMVDVARSLVGHTGALAILAAGLLATLSSANASILSSSRAVYALSNDDMLPSAISRVNRRFGTPHIALLAVGVPIASLTLLGRIEILAEVASLLHLLMYGMICVTLISIKRKKPLWYAPSYRAPGYPAVPAVGAMASFGLIFLMQPLSIMMGFGVIVLAGIWYYTVIPEIHFATPEPPYISPEIRAPRILVPVEVPEPTPLPAALLEVFQDLELLVLGYNIVPEQTSPEQSKEAFEEQASDALDSILEYVKDRNIDVEKNIVFTPELGQTVDRYIREKECHAVLTAKPISSVERLLVPLYSKDQINTRLATILHDLSLSSDLPVTLAILTSEEEESEEVEESEELERKAYTYLKRAGIPEGNIRSNRVDVAAISEAVSQLSSEDDVVILGESSTTDRDSFFNTLHEDIEEAVECPILVVLRENEEEEKKEE